MIDGGIRLNTIKLGLIGLGAIGKTHLRNSQKATKSKIISVADLSEGSIKFAKEMGVPNVYKDYKEMLKQADLDAVIVCLPTFLHNQCIDDICDSGKDILMEKPLARNPSEGKNIVDKVRSHNLKLMVGYPLRFAPYLLDAKSEIDSGDLGFIENVHAVRIGSGPYSHRTENGYPVQVPDWWFSKEKTGGGALLDTGCHMINLLRWYFGDIKKIYGVLGYKYGLEVEDQALCIVEFDNGTKGTITVNWTSQTDLLKVDLYGTVSNRMIYRKPVWKPVRALQLLLGPSESTSFFREIEYFSECIIKDVYPEPSGEDGLKDLYAIESVYKKVIDTFE
jgi:predicted dehydrogenase